MALLFESQNVNPCRGVKSQSYNMLTHKERNIAFSVSSGCSVCSTFAAKKVQFSRFVPKFGKNLEFLRSRAHPSFCLLRFFQCTVMREKSKTYLQSNMAKWNSKSLDVKVWPKTLVGKSPMDKCPMGPEGKSLVGKSPLVKIQ